MNLGYHRPLAERAVDAALKKVPSGPFEHTLKYALARTVEVGPLKPDSSNRITFCTLNDA